MQGKIDRYLSNTVKNRLQNSPAVAILGPRQCGKTTLAGQIVKEINQSVYLDLTHDDLLSHPTLGASFEGFALENILAYAKKYEPSFYRTSAGAEIDLVLRRGRHTLAFELKSSRVPRVSKGFWNALDDVSPDEAYIVAPVRESYRIKGGVMVSPIQEVIAKCFDS